MHLEWSGRAVPAPGATGGGDWYDVVARPDGMVALVLGDVMGHGDAVAASADCMRATIRALTAEGHDAELVMGAARRLANRLATTATLFYGLLDLGSGRLCFCSAGHPPPAVIHPLWRGWLPVEPTPPLGAGWADGEEWDSVTLAPEEVVIVYSDGVADGTGCLPEPTARAIADAVARRAHPGHLCAVALAPADTHRDDRTVLAVRLSVGLETNAGRQMWSAHRP